MLNNFENVLAKNKEIVILGDLNINYILDEKFMWKSSSLYRNTPLLQTIDSWTYECYTIISVSHWSYIYHDASQPLGSRDTEIYSQWSLLYIYNSEI